MKTVYLLRHAKAEMAAGNQQDIDRKLAPAGREACSIMGVYLNEKGYLPDFVLCSSAARTQETFELTMAAAGISPPHQIDKRLYATTVEQIIARLKLLNDDLGAVLVVGHNPVVHQLALTLARPAENELRSALEMKYPTGALTVLRFAVDFWDDIGHWKGELADFMRPSAF